MAQTGYTPISIYYSATGGNTPSAGNLVAGELAINTADGKLFYKDSAGTVQVLATKGGVGSSTTTQVLYNSSGLVVGSANMTFNGTTLTLANDASINGLTVGKGANSVAENTVLGAFNLNGSVTGDYNTSIGRSSMQGNTSGERNTSIGRSSLATNTTGGYNASVGMFALTSNTTGSNNVAQGYQALASNTTASNNTAVGYQAGYSNTTTGDSVYIGYQAGSNKTTGAGCTYIGKNTQGASTTTNDEIVIGVNATGKGNYTGFINSSSGVYQGNNSASWSTTSDQRLKKNIVDNNTGLDKLLSIQVRNFEYRTFDEITELPKEQAIQKQGVQLGVIAQELQKVLPECVKEESTGVLRVDTDNLTWYLINAVKELKAEVDSLKQQLGK